MPPRIVLLEGSHQCGTKILASGGGRCNVTHEKVTPDDFNGSRNIVRNILAAFDAAAAVRWFASLGVELKREETGKLFPVTDSAHTVLDALLRRCRELNVEIRTNCKVTSIDPQPGGTFAVGGCTGGGGASPRGSGASPDTCRGRPAPSGSPEAAGEAPAALVGRGLPRPTFARKVILATGGRSLPKSGSDGTGWEIARRLGHTVTDTHQALVPLVLDPAFFHADLSGISLGVELSTFAQGKRIDHRRGQLLFTHFGLSGPVVMDASRHWVIASEAGQQPELRCNLLPGQSFEAVEKWFVSLCTARPKAEILTLLCDRFPERLALALIVHAKITATLPAGQLSREARRTLTHAITNLKLPVTQPRGWNYAEVTAGGVPLAEIDYRTMESRKVPGLYLIGEILDCEGRIGGFNFQWAWSTAYVAGRAGARTALNFTHAPVQDHQ